MERQAKDGTFYRQVGQDEWEPVTRTAKTGEVYKKVGQDDWAPLETTPKKTEASAGDKARATLEGFAESATLNTLPYLKAAGEVATDFVAEKFMGAPEDNTEFSDRVDRHRTESKAIQEKAPGYALGGQIAGFVVPGAGAAKVVGKGVQAMKAVPALATTGLALEKAGRARKLYQMAEKAKLAGKADLARKLTTAARADLAKQGIKLGAEGALLGAAYTPDSGFTDIGARAEGAALGAVTGVAMPFALRGAGNVVKGTAGAAGTAGKKVLSAFGSVSEDVIDRYLQDPERIRGARSFDELYEQVTTIVGNLGDDLDNARVDYDTAKSHLDEVARGIKESRIEGKAAALEEVQRASAALDEAFKAQKSRIAEKASPTAVEPLVNDALTGLKKKVIEGSQEATSTLTNKPVSVHETYQNVLSQIESLSQRGSKAAAEAADRVRHYGRLIFEKGKTAASGEFSIPQRRIKELIQDLDSDINSWNMAGGSFDDAYNASLKQIRRSLDEQLKGANKSYASKMADVATDSRTLGDASEKFGKPDRALSRLGNLARPSAKYDVEALSALSARTGGNLKPALDDMVNAQRTLKSPTRLESLKSSLPERKNLRMAEMNAAVTKRLAKPRSVREAIENSAASFKMKSAKAKLEEKKALFNKFKSFGEQGAQAKLKQVAQGKIYAEKTLRELSELADDDFVAAVKAAQDASAFTKTAFNGSRNVNLWAVLGTIGSTVAGKGGAGAAGGFIFGGPVGMALGAVAGAMVDVYGPRVTKKILDGIIKIKGPVTSEAIKAMNLPEHVKRSLTRNFKSAVLAERAAENARSGIKKVSEQDELDRDSSTSAQYRAPNSVKGEAKWASDGFDKFMEHTGQTASEEAREEMMNNPKLKRLLIRASDLKPGTKAMDQVQQRIEEQMNGGRK